jgi:membrane peptidoglycan carboxypeptidase
VTPAKVLEMARDAGIEHMWNDDLERQDLGKGRDMNEVVPSQFNFELGIGQYPVTVLDHANGVATMAASGVRANAHFVVEVKQGEETVYGETLPGQDAARIMNQQAINDLDYALSKVSTASVSGIGWDTAGKTGTWQFGDSISENAHAWMVGYTKKIAAAVWVGAEKGGAIKMANGKNIFGSDLPGPIWKKFMADVTKAIAWPKENTKWNPPNFIGDENPIGSVPSPTPAQPENPFPPTEPPGNGGGGGGGGGGGRFVVPSTPPSRATEITSPP